MWLSLFSTVLPSENTTAAQMRVDDVSLLANNFFFFCMSVERFTEIVVILQLMGALRMNFCPVSSSAFAPWSHLRAGKDKKNDNRDQLLFFIPLFGQVNVVLKICSTTK